MNSPATHNKERMDLLEKVMSEMPQIELPLQHQFTPGLYIRSIFMKKGTLVTSARHLTRHPFVVRCGVVQVIKENGETELLKTGHLGITEPGTRRALLIMEDTVWTTFHVTSEKNVKKICENILDFDNKHLQKDFVPRFAEQHRRLQ